MEQYPRQPMNTYVDRLQTTVRLITLEKPFSPHRISLPFNSSRAVASIPTQTGFKPPMAARSIKFPPRAVNSR